MADIKIFDPKTGRTGTLSADDLPAATRDGLLPAEPVRVYDSKTGKTGEVAPEHAVDALGSGMLIEGSRAHQVASTGKGESLLRGAAQGATLGFADELTGMMESLFTDKTYQQARDESRANYGVAKEANPWTSVAGEALGGLATAAVPGLSAARGLKGLQAVGAEAALGGKLGAAYGLGNSTAELRPTAVTADSLGKTALEVAEGGALGAATGGLLTGVSQGLGAMGGKVANVVADSVDPVSQRLQALGATARDFMGPRGNKATAADKVFKDIGIYDRIAKEGGDLADIKDLSDGYARDAAAQLHRLFEQVAPHKTVDTRATSLELYNSLREIAERQAPAVRDGVMAEADALLERFSQTGGNIAKVWGLKKDSGHWVGSAWEKAGQMPAYKELYAKANTVIEDALEKATAGVSQAAGMPDLARLNQIYGATANLGRIMDAKLAKNMALDPLALKIRDVGIMGAIGSGVGSAVGGPVGLAIGGAVGGIFGQSLRSTQGRMWRARVGEMLHVNQQQQAVAQGAIPRNLAGVKQMISQNPQAAPPQFQQQVQDIMTGPPPKAEAAVRMLMPVFGQMMAPSPFPSEFNGKISSAEDHLLATKVLETSGLSISEQAEKQSAMNKDGTLDSIVYAPVGGLPNVVDPY